MLYHHLQLLLLQIDFDRDAPAPGGASHVGASLRVTVARLCEAGELKRAQMLTDSFKLADATYYAVKVDALAALRAIGAEARARGLDADATAADLETCLAGFRAYCVARFACLIPIEVDDEAYRILYHDVKICGITRRCWRDDCAEVL
jgi:hypothetical protein